MSCGAVGSAKKTPECHRKYQRDWRSKNRERVRAIQRKHQIKYRRENLELAVCEVCGGPRNPLSSRKSGRFFCQSCAITWASQRDRAEGLRLTPNRVRALTDIEAAWIGALVEGEGTVNIRDRGTYDHIQLSVTSTEIETIATLLRVVGDGFIHYTPLHIKHPRWRDAWTWTLGRKLSLVALLSQILPYLISKADPAREAISIIQLKGTAVRLKSPEEERQ